MVITGDMSKRSDAEDKKMLWSRLNGKQEVRKSEKMSREMG